MDLKKEDMSWGLIHVNHFVAPIKHETEAKVSDDTMEHLVIRLERTVRGDLDDLGVHLTSAMYAVTD